MSAWKRDNFKNDTKFHAGEIYFFSSTVGGTFATVTGVDTGNRQLAFAVGGADTDYGLNRATDNNLQAVSNSGALAVSLQRMQIIHYYVNSNSLLMRRVLGVQGATFRDSIIAEHVLNVQFKYSLETTDASGNVLQPTTMLDTKAKRLGARQVEVTITVETPHALQNNVTSKLSMTTSTSVRNMQFRRAVQPGSYLTMGPGCLGRGESGANGIIVPPAAVAAFGNDNTRVPFFGDLPYIGILFRNQVNSSSKTELLVFITPRIVTERMTVR